MKRFRFGRMVAVCAVVALLGSGCAYVARVSVNTDGTQQRDFGVSNAPTISADGRYIAFQSGAANLISANTDTNGKDDIFLRDTVSGTTTRVSVTSSGAQANDESTFPAISGNGRYVAFLSKASNLTTGNVAGSRHVFVRDTQTGTTTQVDVNGATPANGSVSDRGAPSISTNGDFIAFDSTASNLGGNKTNGSNSDVFVRDTIHHTTTLVSTTGTGYSNGESYTPSISSDGSRIAFTSSAGNLVPGDTTGILDVFVRNLTTLTTARVSVSSGGVAGNGASQHPSISADGLHVAFKSIANNLVTNDTNATWDVYRHDLTGQLATIRVDLRNGGAQSNGTSAGAPPGISGDGRYISFDSADASIVPNDTNGSSDVFVRDTGPQATTTEADTDQHGAQTPSGAVSDYSAMSADGHYVAFRSQANNLVPNDTNGVYDVFVHANPVPILTGVSPNTPTVSRGTTATITVNGLHLLLATTSPQYPGVTGYFGADISVSTTRITESQVKFTITVGASAATGERDVDVYNPGTRGGINPTTTDALSGAAISFSLTIQ